MSQARVPKHHCSGHKQGTVTTATHKASNSAKKTNSLCKHGKTQRLITMQKKKKLAEETLPCGHVDSCVNTILTAPVRHISEDPTLYLRRGSKSCQCHCQKRMGYKASAKEIQTAAEKITKDRSCNNCVPTKTRSIQFQPAKAIVLTQTQPLHCPAKKKSMHNVKVGFQSCFTVDADVNMREVNKTCVHSRAKRWSLGSGYNISGPDF